MKEKGALFTEGIVISVIFLALTACAAAASDALLRNVALSGSCGDYATWTYDPNTFTLTLKGTGNMTDYNETNEAPWRDFRESIKKVVVKNGITSLGSHAFYNCISMKAANIPSTVTSIGDHCFQKCHSLESIVIPLSVTSMEEGAFYSCTSLKSVTVPASVKTLGASAFAVCTSLQSVTIQNGVTTIGDKCFHRCFDLKTISIPGSVTSIGEKAFLSCRGLTSIRIPESVESIGKGAFQYCSSLTSITIPGKVKSLEYGTFSGCTSLTSITIPTSVESIGTYAFEDCVSLNTIDIPSSVKSIEYGTFQGCSSLTSIILPPVLETIKSEAFRDCKSLENVTIPPSVGVIEDTAFYECSNLTNVTISDGVKTIGNFAFYGCNMTSITIPSSVTSIGREVFSYCDNLVTIDVDDDNENYTSINGALIRLDGMVLVQYPSGRGGDYDIPNGVNSIMAFSFEGSRKITSVSIPSSVGSIGESPFYGCTGLKSIIVNDNEHFQSIDGVLFNKAGTHLIQYPCGKNVIYRMPEDVTTIQPYSFGGCSELKDVIISSDVTSIDEFAFHACTSLTSITIPSNVSSIGNCPFAGCLQLSSIKVDADNLWYSSSIDGVLFNKDQTTLVQYPCGYNHHYTIPDHVSCIADFAFYECRGLTSVAIPSSVTKIGTYAFNSVNMAYVDYLGSEEPDCVESVTGSSIASTFVDVDVICVPMNYSSSSFCRKYDVKVDSCEKFVAQHNQCYEVLEWQAEEITVKKRANATLWEKKTNNCFEYQCKNESGRIAWSKCNSTDAVQRMCINNKCVSENDASSGDKWTVELDVDINPNDYDQEELAGILANETGIEGIAKYIGTITIDKTGNIVKIVVYVDKEDQAKAISNFAGRCFQDKN